MVLIRRKTTLEEFKEYFIENQQYFINVVLLLVILCGSYVFHLTGGVCPKKQPLSLFYGICFLCGPAFLLLILCLFMNNLTWQLCQGYRHRRKLLTPSKHNHQGCGGTIGSICTLLATSMMVPMGWLFLALLDGDYYVCIMSSEPNKETEQNAHFKTMSRIIGWTMLSSVISLTAAGLFIVRCSSKLSFFESRFMAIYQEEEKSILESFMRKKAQEQAELNAKLFLEMDEIGEEDWHCISMVPPTTVNHKIPRKSGYTSLQRWDKERSDMQEEHLGNQYLEDFTSETNLRV